MASEDHHATGERLVVAQYQSSRRDFFIYASHLATYEFARSFVIGRRVLDFGCGTGYGTSALAPDCDEIVGVDVSAEAVSYARDHYAAPNATFSVVERVEEAPLPFMDGSFDVVLSFQVVEHVADVGRYLSEVRRVLGEGGTFVCATPNRDGRLFPGQRPWNRFHVREYAPAELQPILERHFDDVRMFGMTAAADVIGDELRQSRRTRLLTYPVTFPGAPEWLRQRGLVLLKRVQRVTKTKDPTNGDFGFDASDIRIEPGATPSVNIVATARRGVGS